jgi:tRNA nucleotidyltransferase (CCA-adding enzyme)
VDPPSAAELRDRLAELPAARGALTALRGVDGVYLVGGAVRDLLLGRRPGDLDLVTESDVAPLIARLGASGRAHERFGTATVTIDGERLDLARSRRERYPYPGALPQVTPAPLAEDLRRRDFTVNAMAIALGGNRAGELVAVPGALDDLAAGRLRVLHDASFTDDPTRLLRLARYGARLGFEIEAHTRELARAAVAGGAPATVSGGRLGAELRLTLAEPDPLGALEELHALGLDDGLIPGMHPPDPEIVRRALGLLPADGDPGTVVAAAATREIDPRTLSAALDHLAFEASRREAIVAAATRAAAVATALRRADTPSAIAAAAAGASPELVALAGALGPEAEARRWLRQLRHIALDIDGGDLIAAGVAPGPALGEGLRAALAARLDGRAPDRETQLSVALDAARA